MGELLLDKNRLAAFVRFLAADRQVVGPVPLEHGQTRFAEVTTLEQMHLDALPTILPPKKYFLPPHETLLRYDTASGQSMQALVEVEALVLFGLHSCDLAGIQCLNLVFTERPKDLNYLVRKKHLTLIGLECPAPCDAAAGCAALQTDLPQGGYDLFLTELDDTWFVQVNTQAGEQLADDSGLLRPVDEAARQALATRRRARQERFGAVPIAVADLPRLFAQSTDSPVWDELGARCLACGNCTNVCPTCYCFDVVDEPELGRSSGRRKRVWDSCQHEPFARVAGGENFRAERGARQRHRFERKFHFPIERYGRSFCTGCGRCTRTCMAGIDLKATLGALRAWQEQR